jgi:hypothetical protein
MKDGLRGSHLLLGSRRGWQQSHSPGTRLMICSQWRDSTGCVGSLLPLEQENIWTVKQHHSLHNQRRAGCGNSPRIGVDVVMVASEVQEVVDMVGSDSSSATCKLCGLNRIYELFLTFLTILEVVTGRAWELIC